ncbi:lipoyl synthase [Desulfoluna spongiiphila]|uniref:Lipoyl synthase n=1 Tax=Desulfoluna spongiiphila TaxID=419481 RepID=A0A1G5H770_9BACT|nr:lipoyl synthase [Desulfoluna spongiiphila]SCY58788.1 lipoic acid synthetase [Desulfoluna spongiiphila]
MDRDVCRDQVKVYQRKRKPVWLRRSLPTSPEYEKVRRLIGESSLHTVCQEAKCPNQWECFSSRTATFMILGEVCTRGCRFCAVAGGKPLPPDPEEPGRVAEAARELNLSYVVVTSVTRDDLEDGGSSAFAATIRALRDTIDGVYVEVLIPDFQGSEIDLQCVIDAKPDVLNHNIETVPRLYDTVRPQAIYQRSLDVFRYAAKTAPSMPLKSGIMLGLGETDAEVEVTLSDLLAAGCSILTIGQYLQPSKDHLPVETYVTPEAFDAWKTKALAMGFADVASGPFVRSSYKAKELFESNG